MKKAANAYSKTSKITMPPRQLEASLLIKAATLLQDLKDNWEPSKQELLTALRYNRRLWTVFTSSVAQPDNPLPLGLKNKVASLGVFILKHTIEVEMEPAPEKLVTLININKEIAAGLRSAA
jgi:flagellar protein FlaF